MLKVGLIGYGKAGQAVAKVLAEDPRYELNWVFRRSASVQTTAQGLENIPMCSIQSTDLKKWLDEYPVDAVVRPLHNFPDAWRQRLRFNRAWTVFF